MENTMTKEELIAEIYRMDPSYRKLSIDLSKYSIEDLVKHYNRKKNAPISRNQSGSRGWYSDYQPRSRQVLPQQRTDGFEEVDFDKEEQKKSAKTGVALTGFEALRKE